MRNTCCNVTWLALLASTLLACMNGIGAQAFAEDKKTDRFPKVTLTTQDGKDVEFYRDLVQGKIVIINMMYTQCKGICGLSTRKLAQVQEALGDRLGREVFIYTVTLDPEHDKPEVLKKYADAHGAKTGWTFLTGNKDDVEALRGSLGLSNVDAKLTARLGSQKVGADAAQTKHSGMIVIGYDDFDKWHKVHAQSSPEQILQAIERMKPASRP